MPKNLILKSQIIPHILQGRSKHPRVRISQPTSKRLPVKKSVKRLAVKVKNHFKKITSRIKKTPLMELNKQVFIDLVLLSLLIIIITFIWILIKNPISLNPKAQFPEITADLTSSNQLVSSPSETDKKLARREQEIIIKGQVNNKAVSEVYTAIHLENGQIFIGKIKVSNKQKEIIVDDVFFLRFVNQPANQNQPARQDVLLVKRGEEIWAPADPITIQKNKIIFTEPLKIGSKVLKSIYEYHSK